MKIHLFLSFALLHLCGQALAGFPFLDEKFFEQDLCTYRTQTVKEYSRNCPILFPFAGVGCFRDRNFQTCFEQGLEIGCEGNVTRLQTSEQVQNFLVESPLTLEAELVALNLNLGFDSCIEDWSTCEGALGDLLICPQDQGACAGFENMRINDFFQMGNQVAGGCGEIMQGDRARYFACVSSINRRFSYGRSLRNTPEFAENQCEAETPEPIIETETPQPMTPQPTQPLTPRPTQPLTPRPTQPLTPQPTQPLTPQPTQPLTPQPTQPLTPRPTQPLTPQPTQPLTPQPTQPLTPQPTQPLTPQPTQPLTPQPTQPLTPQPTQPLTPQPTQPLTPEPIEPGTPTQPVIGNTYDLISRSEGLTNITALVQESGFQPILSNPLANLLFFAPTDEAFQQQIPQENVLEYVAYHIVVPNQDLQQVQDGQLLWTSAGLPIRMNVYQENGVITANGVVIDGLARLDTANQSIAFISSDFSIPNGTLYDFIISDPNLSTFAEAVMNSGEQVIQLLQDRNAQLTVFAPTNEAFDMVDLEMADLAAVVQNHIISDRVYFTAGLFDGQVLTSELDQPLMVNRQDEQIQIQNALLQGRDRVALNGVLHTVDEVILPTQGQ